MANDTNTWTGPSFVLKVSPSSVKLESKSIPWTGKRRIRVMLGEAPSIDTTSRTVLVIAHGIRKGMNSKFMKFFHVEMARRGFTTVKFNFPFMEPRWRLARKPNSKEVMVACYRKVLDEVRSRFSPKRLVIGGLSLGAAVASHVVSDDPGRSDVDGLFYFSYPIHRPRNPSELGVRHLFEISKPMLFISGTRDRSAQVDKLEGLVSELGSKASLHLVEGGDHSLNLRQGRQIYFKTLDGTATVLEDWIRTRIDR